ncbi:MAG TPA: hypothetical protein VGM03_11240 [Phycisphaerae bacterium]|jgi:hypothetical protein
MSSKEVLMQALDELPETQVKTLLDFAEFLRFRREHQLWTDFGALLLGGHYGADEPEYTEADIKPDTPGARHLSRDTHFRR